MEMVRDGQKVWPTCPECGCRLERSGNTLVHFRLEYFTGKDARGCVCSKIMESFAVIDRKLTAMYTYNRGVAQLG